MKRATANKTTTKRGSGAKPEAKSSKPPKIGRPTDYTEEFADEFCILIAENKSIRQICALDHMPAVSSVCLWLSKDEAFSERYARAKKVAAILMSEDILAIADNTGSEERDTIKTKHGDIPNKEWILRSKLRVDARFTLMEKLYPSKYGPKLDQKISAKVSASHEISEELQDKIIDKTVAAAAIAAAVQPPASFRGEESESSQG